MMVVFRIYVQKIWQKDRPGGTLDEGFPLPPSPFSRHSLLSFPPREAYPPTTMQSQRRHHLLPHHERTPRLLPPPLSNMMQHIDDKVKHTRQARSEEVISESSSRPCPTCCTCHAGAIQVSISKQVTLIYARRISGNWGSGGGVRTLGSSTSGTTTTLTALGASLGAWLLSPRGW